MRLVFFRSNSKLQSFVRPVQINGMIKCSAYTAVNLLLWLLSAVACRRMAINS